MNKIIFSEKTSLSLKNKSLTTCQYAAVFLKGILLFLLLAMFYLILLPVLAKAGLVPFHYEYTDNYHQFFTWSDAWCTGFSCGADGWSDAQLHRKCVLLHERIFWLCRHTENKIYTDRRACCYVGRDGSFGVDCYLCDVVTAKYSGLFLLSD